MLPRPGRLLTVRPPPIASASRLTSTSPSPEPPKHPADVLVRLRERAEQPLDLGRRHADAAVGHRERQPHAIARRRDAADIRSTTSPRSVNLTALSIRFSTRRAQPHRIADHVRRESRPRYAVLQPSPLACARAAQRRGERLRQRARIEALAPQREAVHARLGGVDHQGGQGDEVLGRLLERRHPAPLALAEIGGRRAARRSPGCR